MVYQEVPDCVQYWCSQKYQWWLCTSLVFLEYPTVYKPVQASTGTSINERCSQKFYLLPKLISRPIREPGTFLSRDFSFNCNEALRYLKNHTSIATSSRFIPIKTLQIYKTKESTRKVKLSNDKQFTNIKARTKTTTEMLQITARQ